MKPEFAIGLFASICTGVSMLPQLVKLLQEKKAKDISILMLIVLLTGLSGWVLYGILKKDWILTGANGFSWVVTSLMILFTIKYKQHRK